MDDVISKEPLDFPYDLKSLELEWLEAEERLFQYYQSPPRYTDHIAVYRRQADVARHRWQTAMLDNQMQGLYGLLNNFMERWERMQ